MKKIIIFGGSFDPIHNGHLKIALKAFKKIKPDKLFFVPSNQNSFNKKISATNSQRLKMIEIAISKYSFFEIDDFEIKQNSNHFCYTIETIKYFQSKFLDCKFYLLIGYDQLINFKNWKDYEEILKNVNLLAYPRQKVDKNNLKEINFEFQKIGWKKINISSSQLKKVIIKKYLNKKIIDYINDNAIYVVDRLKTVMGEYRLNHCLDVGKLAREIAIKHNLNYLVNQAYVAGVYHDFAKEINKKTQIKIAKFKLFINMKKVPSWKVLHGDVGAYLLKKWYLFSDKNVLDAIRNHVIPKKETDLIKIIFIADKIAPREDTKNLVEYKKFYDLAFVDISKCYIAIKKYLKNLYKN